MSYSTGMPDMGPGTMFASANGPGGFGGPYASGYRTALAPSMRSASPSALQVPLSSSFHGSSFNGTAMPSLSNSFSGEPRGLASGLYQSTGSGSRFQAPSMPPMYGSLGNALRGPTPQPFGSRNAMAESETGVVMKFTQDIQHARQEYQQLQKVNLETENMASKIADEFRTLRNQMDHKEAEYRRVWTAEEVRVKALSEDSRRKNEAIRSNLITCLEKIDVSNRAMFEVVEGMLAMEGAQPLAGQPLAPQPLGHGAGGNFGLTADDAPIPSLQQPGSGPMQAGPAGDFGLEPVADDRQAVMPGF